MVTFKYQRANHSNCSNGDGLWEIDGDISLFLSTYESFRPSNIKYTPVAKRSLNEYDDDDYCS